MEQSDHQITEYPPVQQRVAVDFTDNSTLVDRIKDTLVRVSFNDPPFILLLVLHIVTFGLIFKNRKDMISLTFLFGFSSLCFSLSTRINQFLLNNYAYFKFSANYFDTDCRMTFFIWSLPFLLESVMVLILSLADLVFKIADLSCFRNVSRNKLRNKPSPNIANPPNI